MRMTYHYHDMEDYIDYHDNYYDDNIPLHYDTPLIQVHT